MVRIFTTALFLSVLCALSIAVHAQSVSRSSDTAKAGQHTYGPLKTKGPKPISRETSIGYRLNSDGGFLFGGSLFVDIGRIKSKDLKHSDMFYNVRFWEIEFTEKKNPGEYKSVGAGTEGKNKYIYGKINNFFALKLGRGYSRMLAGKPDPGSVSIHWVNAGGVSLGVLKPYYLKVYSDPNAIKYEEGHKEDFLNQYLIEGNAGFSKGIGEVKFIPGFHLKSGLHFDFSANRTSVFGAEVGGSVEYYTQEVPLMANQAPKAYFVGLYLSLQVGMRK